MAASCAKDVVPTPEQEITTSEQGETVQGEIIVKFAPYVSDILDQHAITSTTRSGAMTRSGVLSVDQILELVGAYELERVFPVDSRHEERTREDELHLWYVVRFSDKYSVEEVEQKLSLIGDIQIVEQNRTLKRSSSMKRPEPISSEAIQTMTQQAARSTYPMNDALIGQQWHLINDGSLSATKSIAGADLRAEEAWTMSTGDPSIIVAVLDEGIAYTHEDLASNMWNNEGETYDSKQDNDGNGYEGDVYGYNFVLNTPLISWEDAMDTGHGTHVAGTVAARNGNSVGVASIAGGDSNGGGVKLMSCQLFAGNKAVNTVGYVRAIKYAADNGAVVLQVSVGYNSGLSNPNFYTPGYVSEEHWETSIPLERKALDYFLNNAGSPNGVVDGGIAVFAAGNEEAPMAGFPSAASGIVSVAATAADYTPTDYTNYDVGVDIAAPGGDQDYYYELEDRTRGNILSTVPTGISPSGYAYMEGTSMACPNASGTVALALSYAYQLRKHFKAEEIIELLYQTATPIDSYMTGVKTVDTFSETVKLQMELSDYYGKMGAGQVNAAALLKAIEGSGVDIKFPNLYISTGGEVATSPADYFLGDALSFTVTIADTSIASYSVQGQKYIFQGLKEGATKATITAGGTTHEFIITVRQNAGEGWM